MGDKMGFLEIRRKNDYTEAVKSRILHFEEFHIPMEEGDRRGQAERCKDCGVPFCQIGGIEPGVVSGCPLGSLIPEWNDLLSRGNDVQAFRRLEKTNNFPEFTSRVCPAPCENACTGNLTGSPVSNRENERYLSDYAFRAGLQGGKEPSTRSGKKVVVIGSGPAGLAAADQLNHRGHLVTVIERDDRPGGLLMYGIPNMKLDKKVVERTTKRMEQEGVCFRTGTAVTTPEQTQELLREFDAVILACGARVPRDVEAPGREAEGILYALDYLTSATRHVLDTRNRIPTGMNAKGKRVIVIGGGDTGTDCVATAVRQGCRKITQLIRRPEPTSDPYAAQPWPYTAGRSAAGYGQEEAAEVFGRDPRCYQTRVKEFLKNEEGRLTAVITVRLEVTKEEGSGRTVFTEIPGSERKVPCDMVLIAAGYAGPEPEILRAFGLESGSSAAIPTLSEGGYQTPVPKVFAAGDCRRGQSLVVWAIQEGREAARAVDEFLMGYTL